MIDLNGTWKLIDYAPGQGEAGDAYQPDFDDRSWMPATVPGDVHTSLVAQGRIEPPFYNMNVESCRWVEDQEWWFRRSFDLADLKATPNTRTILRFDGLDTYATIYLNGVEIGQHANMFIGIELDVTEQLIAENNVLAIRFDPVMQHIGQRELEGQWAGYGQERVWVRKAQYNFSWDWAPRLLSVGIWQDVSLQRYSDARLASIFFKTDSLTASSAQVSVDVEIERWADLPDLIVEARLERGGRSLVSTTPVTVGTVHLTLEAPDPDLWWTQDLGEPALYELTVQLLSGERVLDTDKRRVGIRTIEVDQSPDPDEPGTRFFTLVLNGVRLFARGADWIPADSFIAQVSTERYRDLLELAVDANMNCLRVWGGGVYEKDVFYGICDELGLLVWQDFMFACALYPDFDPEFVVQVEQEAESTVRRLRNHPSIALWCGSNENPWIDDQNNWRSPGRDYPGKHLYEQVLPAVVDRLDGTRLYWPSSPYGGDDHNDERQGNRHNWQVWHGLVFPRRFGEEPQRIFSPDGVSYRHYGEDMARFVSEFGMHASPILETLGRNVPAAALRFGSPELLYRNKDRPKDKGNMLMEAHTGLPGSLQEYVDFSMIAQAEGLKFGLEHYRRRKFHCSGALFWQLNDCWPGLSWSVIDYYHFAKAGYFYAKRAYAPVMASFKAETDGSISLWIVNDTLAPLEDVATWELATFEGDIIQQEDVPVSVGGNVSERIAVIPASALALAQAERSYLWVHSAGDTFPDNRHFFAEIKDLALPEADLQVQITQQGTALEVRISSDVYAYFIKIEAPVAGTRFTDNYFDLPSGQERVIRIWNVAGRDLAPEDVTVSCLRSS